MGSYSLGTMGRNRGGDVMAVTKGASQKFLKHVPQRRKAVPFFINPAVPEFARRFADLTAPFLKR
jgi:hypothetical protein